MGRRWSLGRRKKKEKREEEGEEKGERYSTLPFD